MAKDENEQLRNGIKEMLKGMRTFDEYVLDDFKTVIKEDGKEGTMLHRLATEAKYRIDDLLKDELPDFFALAILQLYRKISGEYTPPTATPKALDVVQKGSKPDPALVLRRAEDFVESLVRNGDDKVSAKLSEYLIAYLTYRSRIIAVSQDS
jgi:hypothetical protein